MEYVALGMLLIGLLWVVGFGYAHYRAVSKARAAESWPTAMGRVLSCEVVEEESTDNEGAGTNTWYRPVVRYSYSAGGRELQGSRLGFGNYRSGSRARAELAMAPYAVGSTPPVRYNPDNPQECVLETKKPGPVYLVMAAFGLLFVAFGLFWNAIAS
jgi:hypothetical protein